MKCTSDGSADPLPARMSGISLGETCTRRVRSVATADAVAACWSLTCDCLHIKVISLGWWVCD